MPTEKKVLSGRQETVLKELQGRWFEMGKTGVNGGGAQIAVTEDLQTGKTELRENLSLITRLPAPAREQLFDQFLASISGQLTGSISLLRPSVSEDLRQRNIDVFYKYIEYGERARLREHGEAVPPDRVPQQDLLRPRPDQPRGARAHAQGTVPIVPGLVHGDQRDHLGGRTGHGRPDHRAGYPVRGVLRAVRRGITRLPSRRCTRSASRTAASSNIGTSTRSRTSSPRRRWRH